MGLLNDKKIGFCPECGCEIEDLSYNFCTNCGWKISVSEVLEAPNNKLTGNNENAGKPRKELSDKDRRLLEKYGLTDSNHFFECNIEEMRFTTISNTNQRTFEKGFVGVYDDKLIIVKQSFWLKSDQGARTIHFNNVASIDYDARGILGASRNLIINMKSSEHVQLKYIDEVDSQIVVDTFNEYMKLKSEPQTVEKTTGIMDELLKTKELLDEGLLTEEEFARLKEKLLE